MPKPGATFSEHLLAILTGDTCGEACWEAREDICRCSCGGTNHGCRRNASGIQPARSSKIDGHAYVLKAVGEYGDIACKARELNEAAGYREVIRINDELTYHYTWKDTDRGAPARMKPAPASHIAKWPELASVRDWPMHKKPYLLWIKVASLTEAAQSQQAVEVYA